MSDALVVGVDVGSQGTCAQLLDPEGRLVATASAPHRLSFPRPGRAEQDPADWVEALEHAVGEVRKAAGGRPIAALAFGSQLDGLVALDARGVPLRPAMIWMDRRADAECAATAQRIDPALLRELSGCNLDAGHVGAKIAWLRANEPETFTAATSYALPGSFVARHASGELAVDPSNASSTMLLDVRRREWSEEACVAFDVDPARLPRVLDAHAVLGEVAPELRDATGLDASTLIVLGCGDEMAATLGAGAIDDGVVCDVIGTAEPVCAVTHVPLTDPTGVIELHPHADPDAWLFENPGWLSGGALRWFRDHLCTPESRRAQDTGEDVYDLVCELAAQAPPGSDGVLWIPALAGAMAPEWNADARACWFGLSASHGRAHLVRALLEGNAFALRDVLEAMGEAGAQAERIVCVGGGARSPLQRSIRADVTGLPVARAADVETTARGAAMLAAAGAGLHPTVPDACRAMAAPAIETVEPDPGRAEVYAQAHAAYRRLYEAVSPLFGEARGSVRVEA